MERREKSSRLLILIFFIPFLLWIILQFLSPLALPHGKADDLSGFVGLSDNEKLIKKMTSPWNLIYSCGDRFCHQKLERTFIINDNQMPFCSRCTAIWLGLAIGLGFMTFYKIKLDEKFLILIFICLVPIGIDGVGQLFGFWESNNIIRLITGLLIGVVCGIAIGLIIDEVRESRRKTKEEKKIIST